MRKFLFCPIGINQFDVITTIVVVSMVDQNYSWPAYVSMLIAMQAVSIFGEQPWRGFVVILKAKMKERGL